MLVMGADQAPVPVTVRNLVSALGPALKTRPSGAAIIIGYSGKLLLALVKPRQVCVLSWNTCGNWLTLPGVELPDTTSVSPLPSAVFVGYQRPAFMLGRVRQTLAGDSYANAVARPKPS